MTRTILAFLIALMLVAQPVAAKDGGDSDNSGHGGGGDDDGDNGGDSIDHDDDDDAEIDRARSGVKSGQILSLSAILAQVRTRLDARIIDADLQRKHGRMIYDLEMLAPDGRIIDLEVEAATGRILNLEAND